MFRRARAFASIVAYGVACGVAVVGAGCEPPPDLEGGVALSGNLDGNDMDQIALLSAFGVQVGDIEGALSAAKDGPRLLMDANRRYDVWTLRVRAEERLVVRATSTIIDPVLAITDLEGRVLGANDDGNPAVPGALDALLLVDNPLSAPATLLVVVTEFGAPTGGGYLVEVSLD